MKYRTGNEVRELFLDYFKSKGHMVEPGAPLVPIDDDTLLWINSGVAALKKYFDGRVKPLNPRIVNVQKSIRTNDIENVGYTARHHTFFEMLGNFSIGDYFKKEAIEFAYEFLFSKEWIGFDLDRMYVSVHTDDTEAYDIWVNHIGIDPKRILRTDDNFWQIGDGPCGPNTEIFYDRGVKYDPDGIGEKLFFEDIENDRYLEVWNVVFSQYDGVEGGDPKTFKELPQKNIDTGMGFERLVSIVQEAETNFDTDLFRPVISHVETLTDIKYKDNTMAYRVIADHIRTLVFALNDGALFSNEGRGYVLRRILRRAVRFGRVLNINESFLYTLVDDVILAMKDFYPDLLNRPQDLKKLILNEEVRFAKTLVEGERLLLGAIDKIDGDLIDGEVAFKLYDTYGFPIELTQEIAFEHNLKVDLLGFNEALEAQKERARSSRHKSESMASQQEDILNFKVESTFVYDTLCTKSVITGIFVDGHSTDSFSGEGLVAVDITPFYAESGGQVSDIGKINNGTVYNVSKANAGQHLHHVRIDEVLRVGDSITLNVNRDRRILIQKNHSAVHLLHAALHDLVGSSVNQAGSYVDEDYFRLDFTHTERLTSDILTNIEHRVNQWIGQSLEIETNIMNLEDAKKTGAMALFGDTYGSLVRVVSMGDISKELCGGTHAYNTGEIGVFKLMSEESVGSGVRRIVGKTSVGAYEVFDAQSKELSSIRETLKVPNQKTILERLSELNEEKSTLQANYDALLKDAMKAKMNDYFREVVEVDGLSTLWIEENNLDKAIASAIIDRLKDRVDIVVIANKGTSNVSFSVSSSEKGMAAGHKAGDLARLLAIATDGNGGGRPNFAQSGGKNVSKLSDAFTVFCDKMNIK